MSKFRYFALVALSVVLALSSPVANGQATPGKSGYITPIAFAGLSPDGSFRYASVDNNGTLVDGNSTGNGNVNGPIPGYMEPVAPVAIDPNGAFQYLKLDSQGRLLVSTSGTGSMVYPAGTGVPIVSSGLSWGSTITLTNDTILGFTGSAPLAFSLPACNGTGNALQYQLGTGFSCTTIASGGASTPNTTNVLKGGGAANSVTAATPNTDYFQPTSFHTTTYGSNTTTVLSTTFNEASSGALNGTHPATDVSGNAWINTGTSGAWSYTGSNSVTTSTVQTYANIDTGANNNFTVTFSGLTNNTGVQLTVGQTASGNFNTHRIAINLLGATGVRLFDCLVNTSCNNESTATVAAGATGSVIVQLSGQTLTVTPFGAAPLVYTIPNGETVGSFVGIYDFGATGAVNIGGVTVTQTAVTGTAATCAGYVDSFDLTCALPGTNEVVATDNNGHLIPMPELGTYTTNPTGGSAAPATLIAWHDDLKAGIYDARDTRWAGGVYGTTPWLALQAVSNQVACDISTGVTSQAMVKVPPGVFQVDNLIMAPGSYWLGAASSEGGTTLINKYNGHQNSQMPGSMTATCSDGLSHTDSQAGGIVSHFTFQGCSTGGCTNAPSDTTVYEFGGPGNVGFTMGDSIGKAEFLDTEAMGGVGIYIAGTDSRGEHLRSGSVSGDLAYYYFSNGYKGVTEGAASTEFSGNVASGTTGSVALTWTASASATGYVVYKGTSTGGENQWFLTTTTTFTDTCAAGGTGGPGTAQVTNALLAPTAPGATGSITGGTCAAGNYYYVITPTVKDTWHATMMLLATDGMYDWIEPYGFQNAPTAITYHHLADIALQGGVVTLDHAFPQWGQVGITIPGGGGSQETVIDPRVDFANLEGILVGDGNVNIIGGVVNGCMASNAQSLNGGICDMLSGNIAGANATGLQVHDTGFATYGGFGPNYATGDYLSTSGVIEPAYTHYGPELFGGGAGGAGGTGQGRAFGGSNFRALNSWIFQTTGSVPNVFGQVNIQPNDSSATNITGFAQLMGGQPLYIYGGNANDTLVNGTFLRTCNGQNINLGNVANQYLQFYTTADNGNGATTPLTVRQVCATNPLVASSETVTFSATPTFSPLARSSVITLTANITSFTMAAGYDGQEKSLIFCQNGTGGFTVTPPSNVLGLTAPATSANACTGEHFTYSATKTAWIDDSTGGGGGGSMTWPGTAGIAVYAGGSAWGTSLAAPTGTIVGTSDTQTLTNKTLDGVSPTTMGFLDATSSIQTQLNARLIAGTITATAGLSLCTDASGHATTTGCPSGGSGLTTVQTNGANNTSMTALNFINSSANVGGLTITASNPATGNEQFEIGGTPDFGLNVLSEISNLNADYYVDGNTTPTTCTVGGTGYSTAFDCTYATAWQWVNAHANGNATVHVGGGGTVPTLLGAQATSGASNHGTVNIIGDGVNASYLQLTGSLASGVCMITQPDETTANNSAYLIVSGLTLDANNNADCAMSIHGVKASYFNHLRAINTRTTTSGAGGYVYQFAGLSSNANGKVFESWVTDVSADGNGGGYTPALLSCSSSGTNPTCSVTSGGNYPTTTGAKAILIGNGNGAGPCSVYPTPSITFTSNAVSAVTFSGGTCPTGTVYVQIVPAPVDDNIFLFNSGFTDSTVTDIRATMESGFAGVKGLGHPNVYVHPHVYAGQYGAFEDYGDDQIYGLECDSVALCGIDEGPDTTWTDTSVIYNSSTLYPGSSAFYVDTSVTAPTLMVKGIDCNGNRQGAGGYHTLLMGSGLPYNNTTNSGGGMDTGTSLPNDNVQLEQVHDCSSGTSTNAAFSHYGTFTTNRIKLSQPFVANATTTGVNSPPIDQIGTGWNGSSVVTWDWQIGQSDGSNFSNYFITPPTVAGESVQYAWNSPGTATSGGNFSSVPLLWNASIWTGSAATAAAMKFQVVVGTGSEPTVTYTFSHTGSDTGTKSYSFDNTVKVPSINVSGLTAGQIMATDGSDNAVSIADCTSTGSPTCVLSKVNGSTAAWTVPGIAGTTITTTTDTIAAAQRGTDRIYNSASAVATALTSAATLGGNFNFVAHNIGAGAVTFTPGAGTINGASTLVMSQNESCAISSPDNTNYDARCGFSTTSSYTGNMITGSSLTVGNVYYINSSGVLTAAEGNSGSTAMPGICVAATTTSCQMNGVVTGLSGLTAGAVYYVSPSTAGAITATQPSATGQIIQPLGVALSSSSLALQVSLSTVTHN